MTIESACSCGSTDRPASPTDHTDSMMFDLDLRTVVLFSTIMGVVMSVVMLVVRLGYPKSIAGLGMWATAPLLMGMATFLFAARGQVADGVSIIGANAALLAGVLLFHFGTQRFLRRQPSYRFWAGVMLAAFPLLVWFSVIDPDLHVRVFLVSTLWMGITLIHAWTIWRYGDRSFLSHFTAVVLLVQAGIVLMRLLAAALPVPNDGAPDPTRIQTIYVTANAFVFMAFVLGLVLMLAQRMQGELGKFATRDDLTGAMSRRMLVGSAEQEFERCRRHDRRMAIMLVGLDGFQAINDRQGRRVGDRVLIDFVTRVRPLLRRHDQLGRLGGDEFAFLLAETTVDEALAVAARIRTHMAMPAGTLPLLTASVGISVNERDDVDMDAVLARVESALRQARAQGGDRVVVV